MLAHCLIAVLQAARRRGQAVRTRLAAWPRHAGPSLAAGIAADLLRGKRELVLENALLRQQLIVLGRTATRPAFTALDRGLLMLLASRLRA